MGDNVLEWAEVIAAVVEHSVEHHADTPGMAGVYQGARGRLIAEMRVELVIVSGIVLVVRRCQEYRGQVDARCTQTRHVVEPVCDSCQVASEE